MKRVLKVSFLALLLGVVPVLVGAPQDSRTKPPDKSPVGASKPAEAAAKPVEVVALFHDGTTIRRAVLQASSIDVTTKYGKLTVPLADVRRIEFGLHVDGDEQKQAEELVGKLGSEQFEERERASRDLVGLGASARAALEKAVRSTDREVSMRARTALDRIRAATPDDRRNLKEGDVIHTNESVITGQITTPVFKAKTDYFGEMSFKITHLRSLTSRSYAETAGGPGVGGGPGMHPGGPGFPGFPGGGPPGGVFPPVGGPFPGGPPGALPIPGAPPGALPGPGGPPGTDLQPGGILEAPLPVPPKRTPPPEKKDQ